MIFLAVLIKGRGWRVQREDAPGVRFDICGAVSETVAKETAVAISEYRRTHP